MVKEITKKRGDKSRCELPVHKAAVAGWGGEQSATTGGAAEEVGEQSATAGGEADQGGNARGC